MVNFYNIGAEYAADYDNSEDAWEHAISNDDRVINALRAADRETAADEFGNGFAAHTGDDMSLLVAVNVLAKTEPGDKIAARNVITSAVAWAASTDTEGIDDWLAYAVTNPAATLEEAEAQIEEMAAEWDALGTDDE